MKPSDKETGTKTANENWKPENAGNSVNTPGESEAGPAGQREPDHQINEQESLQGQKQYPKRNQKTAAEQEKENQDVPPAVSVAAAVQSPAASSAQKNQKKKKNMRRILKIILCVLLILALILAGIYFIPPKAYERAHKSLHKGTAAVSSIGSGSALSAGGSRKNTSPDTEKEKTNESEGEKYTFKPHAVSETEPSNLIKSTQVKVEGQTLAEVSDYEAKKEISFGTGGEYTEVDGIITFRGNNFRDSASYGTAGLKNRKFGEYWTKNTSALVAPDGEYWSGNGWTGQPLIVNWSKETRQNMYMESWAQEADHLTEVIYASLDGNIYFLDLKTGEETRPAMNLGYTFKGAGALDPRGYPVMYVGSGYDSKLGRSHAFIINLLDCSVMYTFGQQDPFSLRGNLSFFDSSPLVDAETDQLIYPGENGILYIIKLNTQYDAKKGSLSIKPDEPVRWHYSGNRSWYLGMEDSALIWKGYIFFTTNDGYLFCLNLNTLETVWVQDVLDDTNCTPVLELEDGHPYIYTSTSFHLGWRSNTTAEIPVWKIDAETGEIIWSTSYQCRSVKGNSGGVQGTLALGKNDLKDLIFVPVAKTPTVNSGKIVALDKKTGEEVWVLEDKAYAWSSPVAVYDKKGKGFVITCDSIGDMYLLDGKTGEVLDKMNLGSNVEASPAVYKNTLVVGTRGQKIYGVTLE